MLGRKIAKALAAICVILSAGCATLPPVQREIPLAGPDLALKAPDSGHTKLVIYNNSNILLYPFFGRMNVKLNGKGVAGLDIGQYAQVILPRGTSQLELLHWDAFNIRSEHKIELIVPEAFLEIYATTLSNAANLVPELPKDFEKQFKPAP